MLAFEEELVELVRNLLLRVRSGTFVITTGKLQAYPENETTTKRDGGSGELDEQGFECLEFTMQPFSWGISAIWIHRRN
jgi:hypothetical protein